MKKLFCKKLISAFLATVMLLAMIPAGMVSAVEGDSGYSVNGTTITITTAEGWNAVADKSEYATYDFVLGNDIDFKDTAEDKPLFSTVAFAGTFDGKDKTISNFNAGTSSNKVAYQGIIAGSTVESTIADKKIDTTKYIEIKNVTLENAVLYSSANCGGLVGDLKTYGKFENIKLNNITVSGTASNGWVGGMVGYMQPTALIYAKNCNVTGTITSTREGGGILARLANDACKYDNAINEFRNCYVNATITTNNESGGRIGGIIGAWGRTNSNGVGALLIDRCYAAGTYSNGEATDSRTAGIVGAWRKSTATISNVVIDVAKLECAVCSYGDTNGASTLTLNNIYYTSTNKGNGGKSIFQNGTKYTEGSADMKVESAVASKLVSYDANGYISDVDIRDLLPTTYMQTSSVDEETDTYIIRFVIESLVKNYDKVTTEIVVKNGEGGEVVKTFTFDECTYFESLTGHKADITETYVAGEGAYKDCECFIAVAIMDVPNDGTDYYFEVTPTFTLGGITVEGTTFGGSYATGRPATN